MDNKPKQNPPKDSWKDENDKLTNPNRRQEEQRDSNVDRSGQRAKPGPGSTETPPSDRRDESQGDRKQTDPPRRQPQADE